MPPERGRTAADRSRGDVLAEIGQILGGRYRLIELLGEGGMATVFRATDTGLGRDVALKLLRPEYLRDPDFSSRFRQEAQAAASLSHPNVVHVYDYGEVPTGPFIVMELVDGEDLAAILRRNGALSPRQVARIGSGVARALAAAHAHGLIHRDVKPGNVLIGTDGRVKVVDFGIARAIAEAQLTLPGTTLGSVHYFSPEQARGEPATAASDLYSLGIVLYEMLVGSRPFEGDSAASVALARLTGPIPDPMAVRPSVPSDLAAITRKALAVDPRDRFVSAGVMADALDQALGTGGSAGATVPGLGGGGLAGATVVSGTARPNPTAVRYAPDSYAGADDALAARGADADDGRPALAGQARGRRPKATPPLDEDRSPGPLVWLAGAVAIALLAVIAFFVFQLASAGGTPPAQKVTVPNFVDMLVTDANRQAQTLQLTLKPTGAESSASPGTILAQDPPAGAKVDAGSVITITVAAALGTVPVPDLKNKPESAAIQAIFDAGLRPGVRSDAFDPIVPVGLVASQNPSAGIIVAKGTAVDWVVSKGPTPSPSPTPSPTPSPSPTPPPTPEPTPLPTLPPTLPPSPSSAPSAS